MTLGAGELRLVETEETNDRTSIWSKSTFETEYQTYYYNISTGTETLLKIK
ncbi:hypothetical protein HF078_04695 [Bacillus sp. RO2]|uniref:hypothetical protein n=1 Tax=Bacillus sp. RO2 TaxID=2723913 RepID=UPI00145CCC3F|nr:hypothetical protein [Bacillus sp. RO2]NMH72363.1 hypothetical protein [Bacillus sp. RO2]